MNTKALAFILTLAVLAAGPAEALASSEGALEHANVNIRDTAALQRGAKLFVNYCFSCHSAKFMRYNRLAEDLGLDEDVVMNNLVFADAKIGDTMTVAMRPKDASAWFGKVPPDLSLTARSRGPDWIYSYLLNFYQDESGGWNNTVLQNAAMPNPLWRLQGIQKAEYTTHGEEQVVDHLVLDQPGLQTPEEYEETVRDLVAFMDYLGEPAKLKRKSVGIWVMLFLVLFALLAYALKAEYWRDVH
ncbi:MAG: cytochrome c1 [Lysobacterales bacterium]|jgi:ubiquinol-cytochrome c reductase cytochrome c1 subunit